MDISLTQEALQSHRHVSIVQHLTITDNVVAKVTSPTGSRREGQPTGVLILMQQAGIDIRESIIIVQLLHRMEIHHHLPTPQTGVALRKLVLVVDKALQEDIVADMVAKDRKLCREHLRRVVHT